jgi:hypothetical protein
MCMNESCPGHTAAGCTRGLTGFAAIASYLGVHHNPGYRDHRRVLRGTRKRSGRSLMVLSGAVFSHLPRVVATEFAQCRMCKVLNSQARASEQRQMELARVQIRSFGAQNGKKGHATGEHTSRALTCEKRKCGGTPRI